jgi:dTDP-4-dehydrorhamnose 3,5-epimerase
VPIRVIDSALEGVRVFYPDVFEDDRGFFKETYSRNKYTALGLLDAFVQDSVSFSSRNVLRGLHADPEMSKLVQVLRGRVFDVVVDFRPKSATFKKWQGFYISEHNHAQIYIPKGCLHGFLSLTEDVVFSYKHGMHHDPARELAVRWDDPDLGVGWPLAGEPRISQKDRAAFSFEQALARLTL